MRIIVSLIVKISIYLVIAIGLVLLIGWLYVDFSRSVESNTVSIKEAKRNGFEIIVFEDNQPKLMFYKDYLKKDHSKFNYLIDISRIKEIKKMIKNKWNGNFQFIIVNVKNLTQKSQEITIGYHSSLHTLIDNYTVNDKDITPVYSKYQSPGEEKITYYKKDKL